MSHKSMAKPILISLIIIIILFSLFPLSTSLPSNSVPNAIGTLLNSDYVAMSLTLDLIPQSMLSDRRSATIFAPPDEAFADSGQPSLSLLQCHCSPLAFSFESLRSLPFGTKIPTMSFQLPLFVTTMDSDKNVSLNNVTVTGSPLYDDGSLVVFGIRRFFYPNFTVTVSIPSRSDSGCSTSRSYNKTMFGAYSFIDASRMMNSFGFSAMASFLDLQLPGVLDRPKLTVFAPEDDAMVEYTGNFSQYSSLFYRHVVPCKLEWTDLISLNGTQLGTYFEGFSISITRSDLVRLNGVVVTYPDLYTNEWLAVHGLADVLSPQVKPELEGEEKSSPERGSYDSSIAPDHEF